MLRLARLGEATLPCNDYKLGAYYLAHLMAPVLRADVAARSAGPGGCRPLAFWPPTLGASPGPWPAPDHGEHARTYFFTRSCVLWAA
jgi:hypothetical protein